MARGRFINKKISLNKQVALLVEKCGLEAGLVFTWMIPHLDREGRIHGDPEVIKSLTVPRISKITIKHIGKMLPVAHELGLIIWYEVDGEKYIEYPKFRENQHSATLHRESPSDYPQVPEIITSHDQLMTNSCNSHDQLMHNKNDNKNDNKNENENEIKNIDKKNDIKIRKIIDYYKAQNGNNRKYPKDASTWKAINARLNEGFEVEDIVKAIDGNLGDPWHKERNKHELAYICQSEKKVDEFINKSKKVSQIKIRPTKVLS